MDGAFVGFHKKLSHFCNQCNCDSHYPSHPLNQCFGMQIREYKYLKVNYESLADWKVTTDYLQCNPMFHGAPQYDCAIIQLTEVDVTFVCLICIFSCQIPDICSINLAYVQPFTARMGATHQIDHEL
ncbi:hypothetical protein PISMIDRAFT_123658 [Pisolithus microcarpus 441]|uniref:Uncharacterized protein n=1 Tax=Pisolithus microcarpus 441 TaxID=765257 RepID=A0A0C9YKU6_9AGAM|nr:hypothetical protein PISMIDRAFT_123658 [Pisolithus microcarpus 441]